MRDTGDTLAFAPRLPSRIARLSFRLLYRGRRLLVQVRPDAASYELLEGEPLELVHHGEEITVARGSPTSRAVPPARPGTPPEQPQGRRPPRRHREA